MLTLIRRAAALCAAILLAAAPLAAADDRYAEQKVVYHINYLGGEGDKKWRGALRNIQNHINAVGADNMEIRVVLHGNGVELLRTAAEDLDLQQNVLTLKEQQVAFQICRNTLVGRDISYEDDLFDVWEEDIIPSGVAELSHLQQDGYTYIKP